MNGFTHIDNNGNAVMVDVSDKETTNRYARAGGMIRMSDEALRAVEQGSAEKGDVLNAARIAGIMAAKKTPELIPLCHPLRLSKVGIDLDVCPDEGCIKCECSVRLCDRTGAEMEALTGVTVALLTIYDMCKAIDKTMEISAIRLLEKSGGKSGNYFRCEE